MKIEVSAVCVYPGCNERLHWSRGLRGWFPKDVARILCNFNPTPESGHAVARPDSNPMPLDLHPFALDDAVMLINEAEFTFEHGGFDDSIRFDVLDHSEPARVVGIGWDGKHHTMTVKWYGPREYETYDVDSFTRVNDGDDNKVWCEKHLDWIEIVDGRTVPGFAGSIDIYDLACGCQDADLSGDTLEVVR